MATYSLRPSYLRVAVVGVALATLVAACGDGGLLDGVGKRSQETVLGDISTSSTAAPSDDPEEELGVVLSSDLVWWNDGIPGEATGDKNYIVSKVWERAPQQRFHQASRVEIVQALPNIAFPGVVPDEVQFVTSQLVYDTASALLDAEFSAAFGLWPVEPYSVQDASVAVLRVGEAGEFRIDGIVSDVVNEGISLSWTAGSYRYELFCRTGIVEDLCWQMAESAISLAEILPTAA